MHNDSSLAASGAGADQNFPNLQPDHPVQPCREKTWVTIELKDTDGNPVPGEAYKLELTDGRIVEGKLDDKGTAGADGIDPGQCKVWFPNLDASEWKPA